MAPHGTSLLDDLDRELLEVLGGAPSTSIVGVEHEYVVRDGDGPVFFADLVDALQPPGVALHPTHRHTYRTHTGTALIADGGVAEVATPPEPVGADMPARLDAWSRLGEAQLAAWVGGSRSLNGGSTHISVSTDLRIGDLVARRYATCFAPLMMLLLDGIDSPGLLVRPRPGRTELCGEYAAGTALRAASVFAAGSVTAAAAIDPTVLPPMLDVVIEPGRRRHGWYVDRGAFGCDLYREGRAARLRTTDGRTVAAQSHIEASWSVARAALRGVIGEDDLGLVDNVVEGRLPLPTEGRLASRPVPTLAVPPEGAAVRRRQLGDLALEPVVATWDFVTFRIVGRERTALVNVPRGQLGAFVASVDAGRLDGLLARYVANPNAARVLRTYAQTERVGGYTSVRPGPSMLPPDRPGVGPGTMVRGRPGKRLPPVPPPSADGGIRWWWWIVALVIAAAVAGALLLSGGGGGDEGERGEGVETQPTAPTTTEPSETTTTEPAVTTTEAAPQPPPTFFHAWQGEGTPELAWEDVAGLSVDEIRGLGDRLAVPGFSDSPLPNDGNTFPFPRRQFTLNPPDESTGGAYCASPYYTGGPGLDVFGNPVPESSELCSWGSPSVGDGVIYLSGDQLADWLDAFGG